MKITTRFMSVKLLIFAKVVIFNFIFDIIDVFTFQINKHFWWKRGLKMFCLPTFDQNREANFLLQFVFVFDKTRLTSEEDSRNFIFKIFLNSKLRGRLDRFHKIFGEFMVGIYEFEVICNLIMHFNMRKSEAIFWALQK